ncbi:DUF6443 domain-containing protein [Chryseobacterium sp. KMC2]|uniref:DUF6443 domain-containing protein n=1 Tax=Chryseobacterium sp. KMC2 TaxID=2800705 RepID=UPI0019248F3F|nr:DUF6443 domain-containing protein [Chryseobacterium sp. KMC2]MBL3548686.1 RHS repeat-associated core domain-containing protein [Chryseobacterium sp. KMC2]
MKKIIIPIGVLLTGSLQAQLTPLPNTENYIQAKTYLDYNGAAVTKSAETVQYFDGLGRPKQVVNVKASPLGRDVVTHIEYDGFGRQVKDYLPVPQSQTLNGAIIPNPLSNATNTPYGSEKIYAEKILENSPLNRIQQQIQVGNDWTGKPVKFDYGVNITGEVIKYTTTTVWENNATKSTIEYGGSYDVAQLYKNTVTDEDGNQTIEFKNGKGQTLMVRKVMSTTENADTYYVYNEYDQLAWVVPPKLSKMQTWGIAEQDALAYEYRYDEKSRLVEKKLPGKGWEFMIYDKADRLVMTQDTNLKNKSQWLITEYDALNRVVYTGLIYNSASRNDLQGYVNGNPITNIKRSTSFFTVSGMNVYYNMSPTVIVNVLLSVNYYDTYPAGSPPVTNAFSQSLLTDNATQERSTQGLPLATYVKNIEDDKWTKIFTWYDTKGRVIGTRSNNHLGGYTVLNHKLDFAGTVLQTNTYHRRIPADTEKITREVFTYDPQNRVLKLTHQVNGNPIEILAQNTYNELSQLESKKVGGVVATAPLQQIDYKYNIRGWMTKINDPADLNGKLFGYTIRYNNPINTPYAPGRYNGNIAEVDWRTPNDNTLKRYSYSYYTQNRLMFGHYSEPLATVPENSLYDEYLEYDLNGNITVLSRNSKNPSSGAAMNIDALSYTYTGNRLLKVKDATQNNDGYPIGGNTIEYDANGNMTSNTDKGISSIEYNYLNLPKQIVQSSNITKYIYQANGTKVKKFFGNKIEVDYLDGFQYKSTFDIESWNGEGSYIQDPNEIPVVKLRIIPTSEGYYDALKQQYIYNFTDHLGNVRLSYSDTNKDGIIQPIDYEVNECIPKMGCVNKWKSGEIIDVNNYYPFGLLHNYTDTSTQVYQYKYNGKELQETGMYDYGARMYMPDLGRWGVVDPLAETSRRFSPYNYTLNNPIRFIDPDGRSEQDWVKRTGQSSWEYRSDITSEQQAKDAGFVAYANGRGDENSKYTTPMSSNGVDTGVDKLVVLGENGNYTVDGKAFISEDQAPYVSSVEVDKLGKALSAQLYVPAAIMSPSSLFGKAASSSLMQALSTKDVNIMSVLGDTFGVYGTGEIVGGVNELSLNKLIKGESPFRTVFDGSMSIAEAVSNVGFAFGSKGLGKVNGITVKGATGLDKSVVGVNSFLIGTGVYGAAGANASAIQNDQKRKK